MRLLLGIPTCLGFSPSMYSIKQHKTSLLQCHLKIYHFHQFNANFDRSKAECRSNTSTEESLNYLSKKLFRKKFVSENKLGNVYVDHKTTL
jgi:hypothetical protein